MDSVKTTTYNPIKVFMAMPIILLDRQLAEMDIEQEGEEATAYVDPFEIIFIRPDEQEGKEGAIVGLSNGDDFFTPIPAGELVRLISSQIGRAQ